MQKTVIMERKGPWGGTSRGWRQDTGAQVGAYGASEKVIIQKVPIFRTLTLLRDVMRAKKLKFSSLGALYSTLAARRRRYKL